MNEGLPEDQAKLAELKRIIERLHDGEGVAKVKKDFDLLVKDVSAEEIASMEQALMKAGMPAEEIQRLCEVHVEVFENSLEKTGKPDKVGGHPVHTFMAENDAARASLKRLKAASLAIATGVPVDGLAWDSALSPMPGYASMLDLVELALSLIACLSFLVAAKSRGAQEYAVAAAGSFLVCLGRDGLIRGDNWLALPVSATALVAGPWLLAVKVHRYYLWL